MPDLGWDFLLLRTISYFAYEMAEIPGGNFHGWQFQEKRTWRSFFSDPIGFITYIHFISEI